MLTATSCDRSPQASTNPAPAVAIIEPQVVKDLHALWESDPNRHASKSEYGRAKGVLDKAVQARVDAGALDEIQTYVEASLRSGSPTEIARLLQDFLLWHFVGITDRARLVRLLASGSADINSFWSIEQELTSEETASKLDDSFGVLFDAYDIAKTAAAKDANYFAVWRALGDLPIKTVDQSEYMKVARPWYKENRDRLQRRKRYDYDEFYWWRESDRRGTEPPHLFTLPG